MAALAALLMCGVSTAQADVLNGTLQFLETKYTSSDFPPPYGTVTITLVDSDTVHIAFSTVGTLYTFWDGSSAAVALDPIKAGAVLSATGGSTTGGTATIKAFNFGDQTVDGQGTYQVTVDLNTAGGVTGPTGIEFDLNCTGCTAWSSVLDIINNAPPNGNPNGSWIAAHLRTANLSTACPDTDSTTCTNASNTFFVGGAAGVPEPATLLLLGTGLVALGAAARRRSQK